jgi:WD40 repeat protein
MKKIMVLLVVLLSTNSYSNELIFGWNLQNYAGVIQDLHFMPDENQFLCLAGIGGGSQIQLRNTLTGDTIKTYPIWVGDGAKFEFTPDSNRIILTNSNLGTISLFSIKDMKFLKSCSIYSDTLPLWTTHIAIDPIKPYVYVISYGEKGTANNVIIRGRVSVYNYETMQLVTHLTGLDNFSYDCLAISKDGKYLSTINHGDSYLKVWSLDSMKLINNFHLCNLTKPNTWGEAKDIKFSEINTDNIFFSISFPRGDTNFAGILKYNINKNYFIDSPFKFLGGNGHFTFFDNEIRAVAFDGFYIDFLNFINGTKEYRYEAVYKEPGSWGFTKYSKQLDLIIGIGGEYVSMGRYVRPTSVEVNGKSKENIYPNPTSGNVNIPINCQFPNQSYEVYNNNGISILAKKPIEFGTTILNIEFSNYSNGIYFVKVNCNDKVITYKIIKEG